MRKSSLLVSSIRPVGAAGAQVPYKHKVTGSNPVPATINSEADGQNRRLFHFEAFTKTRDL
jgi:hypothetical protein